MILIITLILTLILNLSRLNPKTLYGDSRYGPLIWKIGPLVLSCTNAALIILRNGTESVVALFYGTERNTANMANIHKSNLML